MSKRFDDRPAGRGHDLTPAETLASEIFIHLAVQEAGGWTMEHMAERALESAEKFFAVLRQRRDETKTKSETQPKGD